MKNEVNISNKHINASVASGLIILFIGALLLIRQMGILFLPHWLFQWPSILIVVGLFVGAKSNYKDTSWFVIFITGAVFMIGKALPGFHVAHFVWPMAIIAIGLFFIMNRENQWKGQPWNPGSDWDGKTPDSANSNSDRFEPKSDDSFTRFTSEDHLAATVIFNNCVKTILSKNFKGGEVTCVFGNTKLNFAQADMEGSAIIGLTTIFCKTTIIVPADWRVVYDVHSIFANVDDKRNKNIGFPGNHKTLILKGGSIFSQTELISC